MTYNVTVAHAIGQALADLAQQQVPGTVPQGIVDALEIIQVQKQQRQHLLVAFGQPQQQAQLLGEQPAVGQRGETVKVGQAPQPILGLRDFPHREIQFPRCAWRAGRCVRRLSC